MHDSKTTLYAVLIFHIHHRMGEQKNSNFLHTLLFKHLKELLSRRPCS